MQDPIVGTHNQRPNEEENERSVKCVKVEEAYLNVHMCDCVSQTETESLSQ
jgi:hypothetical protein